MHHTREQLALKGFFMTNEQKLAPGRRLFRSSRDGIANNILIRERRNTVHLCGIYIPVQYADLTD